VKRYSHRLPALAAALLVLATTVACTPAAAQRDTSTPAETETVATPVQDDEVIKHVLPRPDAIGPLPAKFEWTAVPNAAEYSLGIWNEVDRMVFRVDHIPANSYETTKEFELEAGTYFWSISAESGGHEIARSGLAAFVVRTEEP
jgi:hypothetical protein